VGGNDRGKRTANSVEEGGDRAIEWLE